MSEQHREGANVGKPSQTSEAGQATGHLLAPITGAVSALRRSRMFHPSGVLCLAQATAADARAAGTSAPQVAAEDDELATLARVVGQRLTGPALVRFSGALWKTGSWHDVLGCALRFAVDPSRTVPSDGDQDMLLATIRRPWTMPFAPLATDAADYLGNLYYGVSPFIIAEIGRSLPVEWRLTPMPVMAAEVAAPAGDLVHQRAQRLRSALGFSGVTLVLGLARYPGWHQLPHEREFVPVVKLRLREESLLDQEALRFDPFRAGRGIVPVGFVHNARRAAYAASQAARPSSSR